MLLGSSARSAVRLTPAEVQTQFSMWAMLAAPLLIGASLLDLPSSDLATFSNAEVIRVNQDPLGAQAIAAFSNCPRFQIRDK